MASVIITIVMQIEKMFTPVVLKMNCEEVSTPLVLKISDDKNETSAPKRRFIAIAAMNRSAFVFSTINANKRERVVVATLLKRIPVMMEPVVTVKV